eukprot:888851_1
MAMVSCPQKCGRELQRRNQETHVTDECPQTMVDCDFNDYGCSGRFKREDSSKHNESASVTHKHLCKVADKVAELTKQNAKQQSRIAKQTLEMLRQQLQIEKLKQTNSEMKKKADEEMVEVHARLTKNVKLLKEIHKKIWTRLEKL